MTKVHSCVCVCVCDGGRRHLLTAAGAGGAPPGSKPCAGQKLLVSVTGTRRT